jgi:hypothetical protein
MDTEPLAFAETLARRKESARRTIRDISINELRTLVGELFPDDCIHPLMEPISRFIEEHRSERALRGETSDGISFVYYPKSAKGIWYQYTGKLPSVGRLGRTSLKLLAEIMADKSSF